MPWKKRDLSAGKGTPKTAGKHHVPYRNRQRIQKLANRGDSGEGI